MELYESLTMSGAAIGDSTITNRSGFAANFDQQMAAQSALEELLERDALLFHWISETPFLAKKNLSNDFVAYELFCADSSRSVIAVAKLSQFDCLYLGLGCNSDPQLALGHAYREAVSCQFRHEWMKSCTTGTRATAQHHRSTQMQDSKIIWQKITDNLGALSVPQNFYDRSQMKIEVISSEVDRPFVIRATHPDLLPLEFGSHFQKMKPLYCEQIKKRIPEWDLLKTSHGNELVAHPLD